ncbi:hypothetical protein ACU4GD_35665 [Cupriavidus basilensis]
MMPTQIRLLTPADAGAFQALRLEGLLEAPTAFGSSFEEERELPLATIAGRLAATPGKAVIGAFEHGDGAAALAGVVGVTARGQGQAAPQGLCLGACMWRRPIAAGALAWPAGS